MSSSFTRWFLLSFLVLSLCRAVFYLLLLKPASAIPLPASCVCLALILLLLQSSSLWSGLCVCAVASCTAVSSTSTHTSAECVLYKRLSVRTARPADEWTKGWEVKGRVRGVS